MIRSLSLFAVLIALSVPATAQTVERTIDLSGFGWGRVTAVPVDTDGNPATEEWAIKGEDSWSVGSNSNLGQWRVVAVRHGGLCIGPWFKPNPLATSASIATIVRLNGRDKLMATDATAFSASASRLTIVSLDTPQCK